MIAIVPTHAAWAAIQLRFYGNLVNQFLSFRTMNFFRKILPHHSSITFKSTEPQWEPSLVQFSPRGILDVNEYIASGLRFMSAKMPATVFPKASVGPILTPFLLTSPFLPFVWVFRLKRTTHSLLRALLTRDFLPSIVVRFYIDGAVDP